MKNLSGSTKKLLKQTYKYRKKISYSIDDKIRLATKNITTDELSQKLDYEMLGFFKVIKKSNFCLVVTATIYVEI